MKKEEYLISAGYSVTELGVVLNPKGKSINGYLHNKQYKVFAFRRPGGVKERQKIHRLQAFQKFGEKMYEDGIVVRHLDGDSLNNSRDNIAIGTHHDNHMDVPEEKRIAKAIHAASFCRKFDKEEVRKFHAESRSYKTTMSHFGITSKGTLNWLLKK